MRRAVVTAALVLAALLAAEAVAQGYGQRRASLALCGAQVDLAAPVLLRLLTGRPIPFEARFGEREVELIVPLPAAVSGVVLRDGGLALETPVGVTVPAELRLDDGTVTVAPSLGVLDLDGLALRYELVDLLPAGIAVDTLAVAGDAVVAEGRGDVRELGDAGPGLACALS